MTIDETPEEYKIEFRKAGYVEVEFKYYTASSPDEAIKDFENTMRHHHEKVPEFDFFTVNKWNKYANVWERCNVQV